MSSWQDRLRRQAASREERFLVRRMRKVLGGGRPPDIVLSDGTLRDFCSNDYLGLAREPEIIAAAQEAAAEYGSGARASRLVIGNYDLHEELETELAAFKGTEAALVYPSGYQANLGLLSLLLESEDAVFVDRLAHACVVDGVRLSPARLRVFPHNDVAKLEQLLAASAQAPARWILVDGVYSMDGDLAPVPELLRLAKEYDATVVMDDAHGTGVVGRSGRGTAEHFEVDPAAHVERLIIVATMSKALGAQGGVVLGTGELREALVNASRPFIYTTGLAPMCAAAGLAALRVLRREPERVANLQTAARGALEYFRSRGIDTLQSETPIIPLLLGDPESALQASAELREKGLLLLPIRPPTVPAGTSRLRMTLTHGTVNEELAGVLGMIAASVEGKASNTRPAFGRQAGILRSKD